MFEKIRGTLLEKEPGKAIVETGGISYRLVIPLSTFTELSPLDHPVSLYLSHVVREDSQTLYAFLSKEERNLFETLIALSGIGPKTAVGIIGHMELGAFQRAIAAADIRTLSKIPGIGKKTAERLVIEMRDKVKKNYPALPGGDLASDAVSALLNLGYKPNDAQKAVAQAMKDKETNLGKIITLALQGI